MVICLSYCCKMVSWLNAALVFCKKLANVKAIVKILVAQAKVCIKKNGLVGQLIKIKEEYECLGKLAEMM